MKINEVKKLRNFIALIKPEAVNMGTFFDTPDDEEIRIMDAKKDASYAIPTMCGSVGCVSGWECALTASEKETKMTHSKFDHLLHEERCEECVEDHQSGYFCRAKKKLGLTYSQARKLFLGELSGWATLNDEGLDALVLDLQGEEGKKAILKQLDYMIKTGKV